MKICPLVQDNSLTHYMGASNIVHTIKMLSLSKITIFWQQMIVKSMYSLHFDGENDVWILYVLCQRDWDSLYNIVTSEQIQKWKNITYYMFYNRNYICTTYMYLHQDSSWNYRTWNLLRTFTIKEAAIVSINLYAFDKPQDSLIYKH